MGLWFVISFFPILRVRGAVDGEHKQLTVTPTPANQTLLRQLPQRREDPDLDCHLDLRARGDHQEAFEPRHQPLHNPTDSECQSLRENAMEIQSELSGIPGWTDVWVEAISPRE